MIMIYLWLLLYLPYISYSYHLISKLNTIQHEKYCALECYLDRECVSWNFIERNESHGEIRNCYLETIKYHEFLLQSNKTIPYKTGSSNLFHHKRVLTGPVAIGRSTILNSDQSFIYGCSYTILVWAWIWKIPSSGGEMAIFTTRESLPYYREYQALLPSIVFNLGINKNKLFFSTIKDSTNDYEGAWGPDVKFQKWMHLAISFVGDRMKIYVNGNEFSNLIMTRKSEYSDHSCPEDLTGDKYAKTHDLLNNTIFQIGGSRQGTMMGMIQHVDIFQGVALTPTQIQNWMNSHEPSQFPTLYSYLAHDPFKVSERSYSEDFCGYEALNYDLCPSELCGNACLSDIQNKSEFDNSSQDLEISQEMVVDTATFHDDDNDIEIQVDLLVDSISEDNLNIEDVTNDLSDEQIYAMLRDQTLSDEETIYLQDTLRQLRGSPMGDPYQDMSDEEVLKMWSAQSVAFLEDEDIRSFINASLNLRRWFSDAELSKDVGQEWQEIQNEFLKSSIYGNTHSSEDIYDNDSPVNYNKSIVKEKFMKVAERIFTSAEVKLQLESYVRNPHYRQSSSPMVKSLHSESTVEIDNSSSAIGFFSYPWLSEAAKFLTSAAKSTLSTIRQKIISHIPFWFYGSNLTFVNQTIANTSHSFNDTHLQLVIDQMLSKLPNRDEFSPEKIQLISDWLKSFIAKQTNGTEEALDAFYDLLENESLFIFDSTLTDKDVTLPSNVPLIIELYDKAMLWYTGRHLIYDDLSHQSFETVMERYLVNVSEPAQSALVYAMWLSDELELEYPDLVDNTYYYQSMTGMLGQPIRLALGYRSGSSIFSLESQVDVQHSINTIISGSPEYLAIGRARSVDFIPHTQIVNHTVTSAYNESDLLQLDFSLSDYLDDLAFRDEEVSDQMIINKSVSISLFGMKPQHPQLFGQCHVAGSYYLPIMKYVTSHFGDVETGVGIPDGVILADLPSPDDIFMSMSTGTVVGGGASTATTNSVVESTLREHYETEAAAGNPDAQMWLGIRSYWGTGGLDANATTARRYFEKAAAQNHSEALFCLGALYENGQGGLSRNRTKALQLFRLSAAQKTPWPAALQALGSYHWNNGPMEERNETLAIQYFQKAAEMGHANGYYSLGLMYRENSLTVVKQNIPLAVHLMSLAASMGHVRAMTNLAHAFFDVESWLGHYAREQSYLTQKFEETRNNVTQVETFLSGEIANDESDDSLHSDDDGDLMNRWGYNASHGMQIILSTTSEVIRLPNPLHPDCSIALPLMKYMAEYTFRPNDLAKNGLKAFREGDVWGALDLYEEAADLGVATAQENAAFLYELISEKYCPKPLEVSKVKNYPKIHKFLPQFKSEYNLWLKNLTVSFPFFESWFSPRHEHVSIETERRSKFRGYDKMLKSASCSDYFHDMAIIRWNQVAKSGDVEALRKLAQRYQETDFSSLDLSFDFSFSDRTSSHRLTKNNTKAAMLYALAASEYGDISSIMSLGWFVQSGGAGVERNLTLAKLLYQKAAELESIYVKYGISWATTQGVAPFLADTMASIELWLSHVSQQWYQFVLDEYQLLYSLIGILFCLGLIRAYRQRY